MLNSGRAPSQDREAGLGQVVSGSAEDLYIRYLQKEHAGAPLEERKALWQAFESKHRYHELQRRVEARYKIAAAASAAGVGDRDAVTFVRNAVGVNTGHSQRRLPGDDSAAASVTPSVLDNSALDAGLALLQSVPTQQLSSISAGSATGALLGLLDSSDDEFLDKFAVLAQSHAGFLPPEIVVPAVERLSSVEALPSDTSGRARRLHSALLGLYNQQMTLSQMDDIRHGGWFSVMCASDADTGLAPLNPFVTEYLSKLMPPASVNVKTDAEARANYIRAVSTFVEGRDGAPALPPRFNSLRLWVAYHTLDGYVKQHGREFLGTDADAARVVREDYVVLARAGAPFVSTVQERSSRKIIEHYVGGHAFGDMLALPMPGAGEDASMTEVAVKACLLAGRGSDDGSFTEVLAEDVVRRWLAEVNLLAGNGPRGHWMDRLGISAAAQRELTARVDIEFAPTNGATYAAADPVSLDVYVKNVPRLTVKVFELNTTSIYTDTQSEIGTGIDLDGLVANHTEVLEFDDAPIHRELRHIPLELLSANRRGVFVVELTGNGCSARALIRKGSLRIASRVSTAGHHVRVFNEQGVPTPIDRTSVFMDGHTWTPDSETGEVTIPFSTSGDTQRQLMLTVAEDSSDASAWTFSQLVSFTQMAETYNLSTGFHLDQEALIKGNRKATLLVRADLQLRGVAAPLELLTNVKLTLSSMDDEGSSSSHTVNDFKLFEDRDSTFEMAVPEGLRNLGVTLSAEVRAQQTGATQQLQGNARFEVNSIDSTKQLYSAFLRRGTAGYTLHLVGKSGEPLPRTEVLINLQHKYVRIAKSGVLADLRLATNEDGVVELGELRDIAQVDVKATGAGHPITGSFKLQTRTSSFASSRRAKVDDAVQAAVLFTPSSFAAGRLARADYSLVRLNSRGVVVDDFFGLLTVAGEYVQVSGLAPGTYKLTHPDSHGSVNVLLLTVVDGTIDLGGAEDVSAGVGVIGDALVPMSDADATLPPAVTAEDTDGSLNVSVFGGDDESLRVHVFATHFVPSRFAGDELAAPGVEPPAASRHRARSSQYINAITLGDEQRYILERKTHTASAGNMLPRAALIINPWSVGTTETTRQEAKTGMSFEDQSSEEDDGEALDDLLMMGGAGGRAMTMKKKRAKRRGGGGSAGSAVPNLSFLPQPAALCVNLRGERGADGALRFSVDKNDLGASHGDVLVWVVATDADQTAALQVPALGSGLSPYKPTCLSASLPLDQHFVQARRVSVLQPGETATITAASDTKLEEYGTLARAMTLFRTLCQSNGVPTKFLDEFAFLSSWEALSATERREKLSQHACHELHLFIRLRDRAFFDEVVRPFLSCKRAKSFMDHFLLDHDLTAYTTPGLWAQLNAAERALLAARVPAIAAAVARDAHDHAEANPTPDQKIANMFNTALASSAFETGGIQERMAEMRQEKEAVAQADFFAAAAPRMAMASEGAVPMARAMARAPPPSATMMASMAMGAMDDVEDFDDDIEEELAPMRLRRARKGRRERHGRELRLRKTSAPATYQAMATTKIWAETHYHGVKIEDTRETLIANNEFWRDFAAHIAAHGIDAPFVSSNFALAAGSATGALMALAVLGLPLDTPPEPSDVNFGATEITFRATASPLVLFRKEMTAVEGGDGSTTVLVGMNCFDPDDRYTAVKGKNVDKFITGDEFLRGKVYGCQVAVTNVSCATASLDVLLQVPQGAVPVLNGIKLTNKHQVLSPYTTWRHEFFFYWPVKGRFTHYPVHVACDEELVAHARPRTMSVVDRLTHEDTTSWLVVSQRSSIEDVVAFIAERNMVNNDISLVAWRCRERAAYDAIKASLADKLLFNVAVWGYAFEHGDFRGMCEYLSYARFPPHRLVGSHFESDLVSVVPEPLVGKARGGVAALVGAAPEPDGACAVASNLAALQQAETYQHLEYAPLVNPRAHQLGSKRVILQQDVDRAYRTLLNGIVHKPRPSANDLLAVVYHLLLQDRVDDARAVFGRIAPPAGSVAASAGAGAGGAAAREVEDANWSGLQYDYLAAYLEFFATEDVPPMTVSRAVAAHYADFPIPKWASKFKQIADELAVLDGGTVEAEGATSTDDDDGTARAKRMAAAAAREAVLDADFTPAGELVLTHVNLKPDSEGASVATATLRFYPMDIERLFSSSPFASSNSGADGASTRRFAAVRPNTTSTVPLNTSMADADEAGVHTATIPIPDAFRRSNVMIEVEAGGQRCWKAWYSNALRVTVNANFGQLRVAHKDTGRPLSRVYVKVFFREHAGDSGRFYKDGYTSLAGAFDYTSLNTDELQRTERFALLVMSDEHGSVIRDVRPPAGGR